MGPPDDHYARHFDGVIEDYVEKIGEKFRRG
jgi:hypothetical protein